MGFAHKTPSHLPIATRKPKDPKLKEKVPASLKGAGTF